MSKAPAIITLLRQRITDLQSQLSACQEERDGWRQNAKDTICPACEGVGEGEGANGAEICKLCGGKSELRLRVNDLREQLSACKAENERLKAPYTTVIECETQEQADAIMEHNNMSGPSGPTSGPGFQVFEIRVKGDE